MSCPGLAVVVGAVDAAVVLQEEPLGSRRVPGRPCARTGRTRGTAAPSGQELRPDALVARLPRRAAVGRSGRRRRWRSRASTDVRVGRGAAGSCGRPGRRSRRPTPGGAGGPRAPRSSANVSPRSVDRQTAPGSVPAYTTPSRRRRARAAAARPAPRVASGVLGEADRRRWASPPRSRRGRRSARPAGRASSTRRPRAAAASRRGCRPCRSRPPPWRSAARSTSHVGAGLVRASRSTGPCGSRPSAGCATSGPPRRRVG